MEWVFRIMFFAVVYGFWFSYAYRGLGEPLTYLQVFLYASTYILVYYFNTGVLLRRFLFQQRYGIYILLTIASFLVSYVVQQLIYPSDMKEMIAIVSAGGLGTLVRDVVINQFTHVMFCGVGLSFKMTGLWVKNMEQINELRNAGLKAEIDRLKGQLSPHFLFNTFNNLYVLTRSKPEVAAKMILGLSDLMRFQLNESSQEKIEVKKEMEYIRNFLDLEKLRKEDMDVRIHIDEHLNGCKVSPLLLFTLVENAVKHGVQQVEKAYVDIDLKQIGKTIQFSIRNPKPEHPVVSMNGHGGMGLKNLQKRLQLGYPGKHDLKLHDESRSYTATLILQTE